MSEIEFVDHSTVTLYQSNASDLSVARSAWVSQNTEAHKKEAEEGRVEGLINFLWKNRHTSPFEHGQFTFIVETPIFVAREVFRHRTCVTGDTVIAFCTSKNVTEVRHKPIKVAWENMHLGVPDNRTKSGGRLVYRKRFNDYIIRETVHEEGKAIGKVHGPFTTLEEAEKAHDALKVPWRRRKLPSTSNLTAISIDESTGEAVPNKVVDIVQQGVKPVYKVTTYEGDVVKATADHQFRTPTGYVELKDLQEGQTVHVRGTYGISNRDPLVSKELRTGIGHWTQVIKQTKYNKTDTYNCYKCNTEITFSTMHLDHVEPVVLNLSRALDETNLQPICHSCHRVKTTEEQKYRHRGRYVATGAKEAVVASVEYAGEEMTYDMVMEAPNHNFVGSNFVLHNCSFNETSARYVEMKPRFYVPSLDRPMKQEGKVGNYTFTQDKQLAANAQRHIKNVSNEAWNAYQAMLESGVAREVARDVLPVNLLTTFWMTVNPRNLMHFLDLRTAPDALQEIRLISEQMEDIFEQQMPLTHKAWKANK